MPIRAIVFDIGGVLEYTEPMTFDSHWEQQLGLEEGAMIQRMVDTWRAGGTGGVTLEEVHQKLAEHFGMSEAQIHAYMEEMWTAYLGTLNQELYDYFKSLRPQYQTAIVSNSFVGAREREEAAYKFSEVCDFIIYSHEVGLQKPDPAIYRLLCERLQLQPQEIIFVDDREEIMATAREMGIHTVLFTNNAEVIAQIEAIIAANNH